MSLTSEQRLVQYTLNVDGATSLPVTFKFFDVSELKVTSTRAGVDTLLVIVTDYTAAGGGTPAAVGNIEVLAGLTGDVITIEGAAPETQLNDLNSGGAPSYIALTAMVDRLTILVQQLKLQTDRSVRIPNTNGAAAMLPASLAARAGKFVGFDAAGVLVFAQAIDASINVAITQFTGGTLASLDALPTAGLTLNGLLTIQPGGAGQGLIRVQILASTAAAVAGVIIRPLDYDAVTNPRQWYVVG